MKSDDVVKNQATQILTQTQTMVISAHQLLRKNEMQQMHYLQIKKLETQAEELCQSLKSWKTVSDKEE